MVPSDSDNEDDGNLSLCDERLSFNFKYDDDHNINRNFKKNDGVMTIYLSALMTPPLGVSDCNNMDLFQN